MAYDDRQKTSLQPHNIILEGRKHLIISGVDDVESFDEKEIIMNAPQGALIIRGDSLRLEKLSLDNGETIVDGEIDSLEYEENNKGSEGFFARLFS